MTQVSVAKLAQEKLIHANLKILNCPSDIIILNLLKYPVLENNIIDEWFNNK